MLLQVREQLLNLVLVCTWLPPSKGTVTARKVLSSGCGKQQELQGQIGELGGFVCPNCNEENYVKGTVKYICTDPPARGGCWSREKCSWLYLGMPGS